MHMLSRAIYNTLAIFDEEGEPIMEGKTWIVAFRDKTSHEVVGPVWMFDECKRKPTAWARNRCYDGCEFAIVDGRDGHYVEGICMGVKESVLQRVPWFDKEVPHE